MSKNRTRTTRWNRLLSGVLCLALALGLLPVTGMVQTAEAHWADQYAQQLVEWGVMSPSSDLRLGDVITRAEFVAMCNRAFGYKRLGGTPFTDVPSSAWYAQDIDIAYNAGYFTGFSRTTAYAEGSLNREQAAVLIARNMRLQATVGETLGFTDSHDFSTWSRGLIGAAVNEGIITGYGNGSFLPFNEVTRGEVAAMLVRALGNPINEPGVHDRLNGGEVYGNVMISSSDVTLRDTAILGNLYITGGVDLGNVLLENVTVLGRIVIAGGGVSNAAKSSVILRNVTADELAVDSLINQFVTISAYGLTDIPLTTVRSDAYLEDECVSGYGLHRIVQDGAARLQLAGSIKEVVNKTPSSTLELVRGTAETITIDELATESELVIYMDTRVDELNLDVATLVYGDGDIIQLNIWAEGCEVEILPERVEVRAGITATVNGELIGSVAAAELSSTPRLMAGYPKAADIMPTQANGMFSGNKPGTIYWAVSELAEGAVSEEDLLHNPVYAGNIYKGNANSIDAESKQVYVEKIIDLLPDGSYYLSAILVDDRGNRSPRKVVSFSTPDDTKPEFVETPYMSRISCETAQVTTMVNKSCILYWVLLPHAAVPPTVQNFKSGNFGGGYYGYGSQSVVKNVPVSVTVNYTRLQENTSYDLYLWLNDFDGAQSSEVYHVLDKDTQKDEDPTFTTPDETAPVVTSIMQNDFSEEKAVGFIFTINEAPSTLYWYVVEETNTTAIPDEDLNSLRGQMRVESGTGAIVSGKMDAAGPNMDTEVKAADFNNKLDPVKYGHNFKLYYMAKDDAGNYSEVRYIIVHTMDSENPSVTLSFPEGKMTNGKPQADTDIILTFSEQVKGDSSLDAETFADLYSKVKYYQDLIDAGENSSTNRTMLNLAKDDLAEELEKHIMLYRVKIEAGRRTTDQLEQPNRRADGTLAADQKDYGWIDWREATVELQKNGTVTLTLPGGKAVSLGGGMEYYFHFENIYDDSYDANLLVIKDESGKVIAGGENEPKFDMASFTTVYAQVWLSQDDTGLAGSEVTVKVVQRDADGNIVKDDEGNVTTTTKSGVLDMVINAAPQSTANTAETDCWDMIIWSQLAVRFDVYRRVDGGDWELAAEGVTIYGASANSGGTNSDLTAASLSRYKTPKPTDEALGEDSDVTGDYIGGKDFAGNVGGTEYTRDRYDTVVGGLQENHVYQYGISFTSVGASDDRMAWTSLVQLQFSLVAGARGNVQNLSGSGNVNSTYADYVYAREPALLDEIGSVGLGSVTGTILEVEKQFRDERLPEFTSTSPVITAGTGTIDIQVALNRNGTVYYVVAPADGTIPTNFRVTETVDGKETVSIREIDYNKDGRNHDILHYTEENEDGEKEEKEREYKDLGEKAGEIERAIEDKEIAFYIPLSGAERADEDLGKLIDFSRITAPTFSQIYSGGFRGDLVRTGKITYEGVREPTRIAEGLAPGTWYYVYLVLQSDSGALGEVVQVYRVQTKDVDPPVIVVGHGTFGSAGVTMTINDKSGETYDSPVLNYALSRKDALPPWFSLYYKWADDVPKAGDTGNAAIEGENLTTAQKADKSYMTVLEALINRTSTGESYFDLYAGESLRLQLMQYITQATSADQWGNSMHYYDQVGPEKLAETNPWPQDCTKQLTMEGEYVMLVCARNFYKGSNDGTNYGFAASQGLFKPDDVAPEFTGVTDKNISATIDGAAKDLNGTIWKTWRQTWSTEEIFSGYYTGTLQLTFSKAIYVYRGSVLKKVVGGDAETATTVGILNIINAPSGVFYDATGTDTSFTLSFKNLRDGQTLTMQSLYNSSGSDDGKSDKRLTVTFDATTRTDKVYDSTDAETGEDKYVTFPAPSFYITWR